MSAPVLRPPSCPGLRKAWRPSDGRSFAHLHVLMYCDRLLSDAARLCLSRLGDAGSLPAAVTPALVGMRQGGKRRVLVPPQLGWTSDKVSGRGATRKCGPCVLSAVRV
jgi:hypothetical protein